MMDKHLDKRKKPLFMTLLASVLVKMAREKMSLLKKNVHTSIEKFLIHEEKCFGSMEHTQPAGGDITNLISPVIVVFTFLMTF